MEQTNTAQRQNHESYCTPTPLHVSNITVCNFRLLRNVNVDLTKETTVLVGRNNSGKTTLAEALTYFLDEQKPKFVLTDFSTESYTQFLEAWQHYAQGEKVEARKVLPTISLTLRIAYDVNLSQYGPLSAAIVDLDPDCTEAILSFSYSLKGGRIDEFFDGIKSDFGSVTEGSIENFLEEISPRIPQFFDRRFTAIDPNDDSNTRELTVEAVRNLITVHFLKAQRGLDDEKQRPKDLIGKVFQTLFESAMQADDGTNQKATAEKLSDAVAEIERDLGSEVSNMMTALVPALESFGYPGLNSPQMEAATALDVTKLLGNYTNIRYRSSAGVSFPESYSGLGSRNLILILLTLLGYYREFATRGATPGLHLIFIEEPEAHLHPQMQEVFIEQLAGIAKTFHKLDEQEHLWTPQFIVSTHSSHIANRAAFSEIRYFRVKTTGENQELRQSAILDLSDAPGLNREFLHQYLNLTRSDLFFADKAILVEGTSERLLVPAAIRKSAEALANQYVTIMEVGGAYAHKFFPLLDFLKIPTLIITDIDTIGPAERTSSATEEGKPPRVAVCVHKGIDTSNATIKEWFERKPLSPLELFKKAHGGMVLKENRYLAYQVPESGQQACGRTLEDAFILANPALFDLELTGGTKDDEEAARNKAKSYKKSAFALEFAIEKTDWNTPRYIQKGLDWLMSFPAGQNSSDAGNTTIQV